LPNKVIDSLSSIKSTDLVGIVGYEDETVQAETSPGGPVRTLQPVPRVMA